MAKEPIDLKKELVRYQYEFDLIQKIPCSREQNHAFAQLLKSGGRLPDGVFAYVYDGDMVSEEFYTIYRPELTPEEKAEYLTLKRLSLLKTIKNCVMFFTILTIIGIVSALYLTLIAL